MRESGASEPESTVHHLEVTRTARYHVLGDAHGDWGTVWYALHGYAQLAGDFLRACRPLGAGGALVVAPEGLSRFYPEGGSGAVAASWMTSEDREAEIADTVGYLRTLDASLRPAGREACALGFSQGAAAASRLVVLGGLRPRRLVLWGVF